MTLCAALPDPSPQLTPEQLALFRSEPDVPRRAVDTVVAAVGPVAPYDVLLRIAVRGALEAAVSHDPRGRVPYGQWAHIHAVVRVHEHLRRASAGDRPALAHLRAAMAAFLAHVRLTLNPLADTPQDNVRALHSLSDGLLATAVLSIPACTAIMRGEQDVIAAESATRAAEAVRAVIAELGPEERCLLRTCFGYTQSMRATARRTNRSYPLLLQAYHKLVARIGARLAWMGVKEMPPWVLEITIEEFDVDPDDHESTGK